MQDKGKPNGLINETSPYLLQHAYNPVNWVPWSPDAFNLAKKLDKPVFVSIGYSTCHWCHVMERESFENQTIANFLNKHFISIKVDREERPDIDAMCMDICQAMTGHGGWPLSIMMDAGMRPFFAGTYFAPTTTHGRIGFLDLLQRITSTWKSDKQRLLKSAAEATDFLTKKSATDYAGEISASVLDEALAYHVKYFDDAFGGFSDRPKFPSPHHLIMLMRIGKLQKNTECFRMVSRTLDGMRAGGIFDHVGYGFHRYSTDNKWLVPHFEKMLYDQALLLWAYTEAWQATGIERYKQTGLEIAEYIRSFMTSEEGDFYSAQDADSDGEEGKYYVWDAAEFKKVVGDEFISLAKLFNVTEAGNFSDEATGNLTGQNILHVGLDTWIESAPKIPTEIRTKLLEVRSNRVPPLTDTKILMDWNGLMIGALAKAGSAFQDDVCTGQAERAYKACKNNLSKESESSDIEWYHSFRIGKHGAAAMLDDYAMFAFGAIELYQNTGNSDYLNDAIALVDDTSKKFSNPDGSYSMTEPDVSDTLLRYRNYSDGAYPSGLSMMIEVSTALFAITKQTKWDSLARDLIRSVAKLIVASPVSFCMTLATYQCRLSTVFGIEIPVNGKAPYIKEALEMLKSSFLPEMYFSYEQLDEDSEQDGILICTDTYCLEKIDSIEKLKKFLGTQTQR
ncbi:MAG: thioredoxin domain-containing protein [Ignavibacteria bacterium]|nr:thioredoxin domain-containing protein [Ignavibacteria bacterium]